jgi:hypothetical protein
MKKLNLLLVIFCLVIFCQDTFCQVYQLMPQYGYQANRMRFDSTLQIPTVCGVPTLKSNVTTLGAIAFDSCNNRFYTYNPKTTTWSQVSGGGGSTDTTSLSARIDARVKYTDTAAMLSPYFRRSLSANDTIKTNGRVLEINAKTATKSSILKIDTTGLNGSVNLSGNTAALTLSPTYNFFGQLNGANEDYIQTQSGETTIASIDATNTDGLTINSGIGTFWYSGENDTIGILPRTNGATGQVLKLQNGAQMVWANDLTSSDTPTTIIMTVVNATGTTLTKGTVVYLFGATGNTASVKRANNKQDSTSSKTLGVVRRDIAAGATGTVTTQGQVEKLNLGAYNEGDILWLDSLDGQLTKNKPVAPYHSVFIGVVERANNGNGLIYIKPQNGVELDEIHDVQMGTLVNNQVLVYSDTQRVWKNRSVYSVVDTGSLSSRINTKLNISDTSVFQRKQLEAYSFQANGTSAAANGTATYFKDTSGTYTGTIAWTGTTAPSGATNHSYRWTRIGKQVTLNVNLVYATNGGALTALVFDLPSDCPTPSEPAGLTAASQNMYPVLMWTSTSTNTLSAASQRGFLRNNSGNNGYEIVCNFTTHACNSSYVTLTYWTN